MSIKFSFVIPVYNAEQYVGRCLDSILAQDMDDFEIICLDDGSKDGSLGVLNSYSERFPGKFKILSQPNQGIGPARNAAFKAVEGKYTWFIDNDDCIQKNCLKEIEGIITKYDADITNISHLTGYFTENPLSKDLTGPLNAKKITQEVAMHFYEDAPWSKIYRTDFLRKNDLFFPNIFGEDTSTTFNLYSKTSKIIKIKEPLYAWFERKESFSHSIFTKKHFETFPILLETLKKQSEACDEKLKAHFDYLILYKAEVHIPMFSNAEVPPELEALRKQCIEKSNRIVDSLEENVFYQIHLAELEKLSAKEKKIRSYYENSSSWKITRPLRKIMEKLRKW